MMLDDYLSDERISDELVELAYRVTAASKFAASSGDEGGFLTLDGIEAVVAAADGYPDLQADLREELRRSNVIDVESDVEIRVLRYISRMIDDPEWPR